MIIADFRSDTVTKPGPEMLEQMFSANVGDDVYGEDPTVTELEQYCANLFGMEAGLFCPSGTMTNQIAIKAQTEALGEVICDETAHIYNYEGGGIAFNSRASVKLIQGNRGRITAAQVKDAIRPDNIHFPVSQLVALENTANKGGGSCYSFAEIESIARVCQQHNLQLHLDGARIFNALVATGQQAADYGKYFDSISICLSKGLGAPVGSVLLGNKLLIRKALRIRKILGGGMRQAGYLAAAGLYALQNNVNRLADDHQKATEIANQLKTLAYVNDIYPVETNIIIFKLNSKVQDQKFIEKLDTEGIKVSSFGPQMIRLVTHLDISNEHLEHTLSTLKKLSF